MMPLFAEFLGTFALLSAILFTGSWIFIGLTLAIVVWAIGGISGGHVNPAVSFAMWLKGSLSNNELITYILVQALGAFAALYAYRALA
jgi:glycerol uptake facilitator-like aquaporin